MGDTINEITSQHNSDTKNMVKGWRESKVTWELIHSSLSYKAASVAARFGSTRSSLYN